LGIEAQRASSNTEFRIRSEPLFSHEILHGFVILLNFVSGILNLSKNSYWFKSGIYSLLQNFFNLVFGFGGFFMLVRILDKSQMGSYTLFVMVTSILEVARVGFVKYGFIKFWVEVEESEHGKLFTAAFFLNTAFAGFVSIVMLLLGRWLSFVWKSPELENMFYVYAITSIVLIPFFQFEYLQHAKSDFKRVFITYFIRNGFLFFAILLSYFGFYSLGIFRLALFNLLGALIASVFTFLIVNRALNFSKSIDWAWVKKLVHFGKFVVGTSLGSMLYSAVDGFMLASLLSTAFVAVYNVAGRITNLINVPSMSLSAVVFPRSASLINTHGKEAVRDLYEQSVGAILCIALPAVVFTLLFPGFIIGIIAPGYLDSIPVLQVTIFMSLFLPFAYQFGVTLDSMGYPNINFYVTASFFVINLTLNYFWILNFGVMGAAYGTLSTTVIGFLVMQVVLNRMLGIRVMNVFKNMIHIYSQLFSTARKFLNK